MVFYFAQVQLCQECIDWATNEKRVFLRQSLEARLIALYYDTENYTGALDLGSKLLKELKKLDDKNLLVEVNNYYNIIQTNTTKCFCSRHVFTSIGTTPGKQSLPRVIKPAEVSGCFDFSPHDGKWHLLSTQTASFP